MKIAIIFPIHNQHDLADTAIDFAIANLTPDVDAPWTREVVALDNGSTEFYQRSRDAKLIRLTKNMGVYPLFWESLKYTDADLLAFFHSDLIISEHGWDKRVIEAFEQSTKLGLLGFVGSNEIDSMGGRGLGTTSNFRGEKFMHRNKMGEDKEWTGSPAAVHGKVNPGLTPAAVVDGCAMTFKREVLEKIKQRENFPPHHFYDRLLSCETRELEYDVAVLGIGCDHISGQTVNQEETYSDMAREWAEAHGLPMHGVHNWDSVLYREAEKQWLAEYRDQKHLVPCKV